jgi:hypothetical protein
VQELKVNMTKKIDRPKMSAIATTVFIILAALGSFFANHELNDSLIYQMQSADKWAFYQAKGIKSSLVETRLALDTRLDEKNANKLREKVETYKIEQEQILAEAVKLEEKSTEELKGHEFSAGAVTLFLIAAAFAALSYILRKKSLLILSFGLCAIGTVSFANAYFNMFKF